MKKLLEELRADGRCQRWESLNDRLINCGKPEGRLLLKLASSGSTQRKYGIKPNAVKGLVAGAWEKQLAAKGLQVQKKSSA